MTIDDINVLNEDEHTALISFSVILKNAASDYFLSWDGVTDDDRLKCEWVVSYYIDAHTDNTATVYVTSALSPEEYGIAQYNEKAALAADSENKTNASTDLLARYVIRDDILSVTYDDGEHYATVPVDVENLMYESGSTSTLKDGSYLITTSKTAFLFGGRMGSSKKVPVTLIYSDDKGVNWTSCELDNIYAVNLSGKIIWRIEKVAKKFPKLRHDPYVGISMLDDKLLARQFYGQRYLIDHATGKIIERYTVGRDW